MIHLHTTSSGFGEVGQYQVISNRTDQIHDRDTAPHRLLEAVSLLLRPRCLGS